MKREEAFKNRPLIDSIKQAHKVDDFIQKIFDEHEEEIKRLKKHDRAMRDYAHLYNGQLKHIERLVNNSCGDDGDNYTLFNELSEYLFKIKIAVQKEG